MSTETMVSAMQVPGLSALEKLLLVFLGDKENKREGNTSRWSIASIAHYLDFSERAVKKSLHSLADKGLVEVEKRPRKTNRYRVTVDPSALTRERRHPENQPPKGEQNDPLGVNKTTVMGEQKNPLEGNKTTPESLNEPQREPPNEPTVRAGARVCACGETAARKPLVWDDDVPDAEGESTPVEPASTEQRSPPTKPVVVVASPRPVLAKIDPDNPAGFDTWWEEYPRKKEGRRRAMLAYVAALRRGIAPEQLLDGLRRYDFGDRDKFWPMASTWLNGDRWRCEANATRLDFADAVLLGLWKPTRPASEQSPLLLAGGEA